jgi:hypothetical protein
MKLYRQGDLLIISVNQLPDNIQKKQSLILLEGEATGHKHQLSSGIVYKSIVPPARDNHYLLGAFILEEASTLTHPEHQTIELPPGIYKFYSQREYDEQEERQVID